MGVPVNRCTFCNLVAAIPDQGEVIADFGAIEGCIGEVVLPQSARVTASRLLLRRVPPVHLRR